MYSNVGVYLTDIFIFLFSVLFIDQEIVVKPNILVEGKISINYKFTGGNVSTFSGCTSACY